MNQQTTDFILTHRHDDVRRLAFLADRFPEVDMPVALRQIDGWQSVGRKIPSWTQVEGLLFPPHLNIEQASGEQTAAYKARLIGRLLRGMEQGRTGGSGFSDDSGVSAPKGNGCKTSLMDLTGGMGIDFAFMAPVVDEAVYVERDAALCRLARHNFPLLGLPEAVIVEGDGVEALHREAHCTFCFIDPARRDRHGARTYAIEDCLPNVITLVDELLEKAVYTLVKLSPMLDVSQAVRQLRHVVEVHVVSVRNECKELLLLLSRHDTRPTEVHCVNDDEVFTAPFGAGVPPAAPSCCQAEAVPAAVVDPLHPPFVLFEPNASIMKAGCFDALQHRFGLQKLAPNSHLFVAPAAHEGFPGRQFAVDAVTTMNKKQLRQALKGIDKANVTVRNFPLTVDRLRQKTGLTDGGDTYIFATTDARRRHLLFIGRRIAGHPARS